MINYCDINLIIIVLGAIAVYSFPGGSGSIHFDDVRCTGSKSRLIDCPHSGTGVHDCVHSEDAGVSCRTESMCLQLHTCSPK